MSGTALTNPYALFDKPDEATRDKATVEINRVLDRFTADVIQLQKDHSELGINDSHSNSLIVYETIRRAFGAELRTRPWKVQEGTAD